jgi:hypothetical protein
MKRIIGMTVLAVLLLAVQAQAFSLLRIQFGGRNQTGVVVNNDKESKSVTDVGSQGSALANILGGVGKNGEAIPIDGAALAGLQRIDNNTMTRQADVSTLLDMVRMSQSDYTKSGGDAQSTGGSKDKTGPAMNAAVTGQGVSGANQVQPGAIGSPTNDQAVTLTQAEVQELQDMIARMRADQAAAKATEARLRAEAAQMQDDIQRLHKLYSTD